jgi:hypothetical protein
LRDIAAGLVSALLFSTVDGMFFPKLTVGDLQSRVSER